MNKTSLIFLSLIIFLGGILRFYALGSNPPALTWDETAWGYNAYSLGIDLKDEFGRFLPYAYLESFGDFKPPVYAYLDILPVKIFGLNSFATRFPSALLGTVTILLTYFLTLQLFYDSKKREQYALFASLMLAISPWHINLSRAAFEANVATFFLVLGVSSFLYAINKKPWFLIVSSLSFVVSMYTFNTSRVVAPILVLLLTLLFFKKLWKLKKQTITAAVVGFLLIAPIVGFLFSSQASLRFREVNIFSNPDIVLTANQEIANDNNSFFSKVIHNRRLQYGVSFLTHYFDNLTPHFLFITGDGNPKFSTQDVGQLYLWSLPFFVIGVLMLFRKKEKYWYLVPIWLVVGIIPAATARETPHALRIETTIPTFQIIIAYGVVVVMGWLKSGIKNRNIYKVIIAFGLFLLAFNVCYYLFGYYVHYARIYSGEWQYGYKQSIEYVKENQKKYDEIQITNALGRPYIYYLFYLKIPPSEFRKEAVIERDSFGFVTVKSFGKYKFVSQMNNNDSLNKKVLYVSEGNNVPKGAVLLKKIRMLNGQTALSIYTI